MLALYVRGLGGTDLRDQLRLLRGADMDITMRELYRQIGDIAVRHIRGLLGTETIYQFKEGSDWPKKKKSRPGYRQFPGKSQYQPLILTGLMYYSINAHVTFDGITVGLLPRERSGRFTSYLADPSEPYAEFGEVGEEGSGPRIVKRFEHWEAITHFIEKGMALAMPDIERLTHEKISMYFLRTYPAFLTG